MKPYDPLEYGNIGMEIARKLVSQPLQSLPPKEKFTGAGVYALYYCGPLEHYQPIKKPLGGKAKHAKPIYVGKAILGGRKGLVDDNSKANVLYERIREHAESIATARNLSVSDFECRYLVLMPVWIALAEQLLISSYKPVWNLIVDGFGNHQPGKGRKDMKRPDWDIVHPGRSWAKKLKAKRKATDIWAKVKASFQAPLMPPAF